ncbi:hypothetical protein ACFQVC_39895 [Streptomyces monticola]|uniref:Uncharacterized protein n=1 Tax=Streptomyces monticola TaxID=2666263 RepID=A0ABW2JXB6_9ACTN
MRVSRTLTALAVSVALSAGTVALSAAPAVAVENARQAAVSVPVDDDRALRVERSFDTLYSVLDELAANGVNGTYDDTDRAALNAAVQEVLAATEAADPEPEGEAAKKKDDPTKKIKADLKAQADTLIKAATSLDLGKLVISLQAIPKLAVDLLINVGLGKLTEGLPDAPKLPNPADAAKLPEAPKVPGLPQPPAIPGLPQPPAIPGLPVPGLPKLPGM